jgi:hypothetical protein
MAPRWSSIAASRNAIHHDGCAHVKWDLTDALDTKTGTLCATLSLKNLAKGESEWANGVPKCNDIWRDDPN